MFTYCPQQEKRERQDINELPQLVSEEVSEQMARVCVRVRV